MIIIDDRDDVRNYLKNIKEAKIKISLHREPIKNHVREVVSDDYSIIYTFNKYNEFKEKDFITLLAKNTTKNILEEGKLENNVVPVEMYALETIWAQIGHRLKFMEEEQIPFVLYNINNQMIDILKKLPHLPYAKKLNLTLDEVMKFAEENYLSYNRSTFLCHDDKLEKDVIRKKKITRLKLLIKN